MPSGFSIERTRKRIFEQPAILAYLIVISLFCWIAGYEFSLGYPLEEDPASTVLWNWLCRQLPGKLFTYLAGLSLLIVGGYLLQRANYALVLIREKTFLPFLLFILLMSSNPHFYPLRATSVAVLGVILALYRLLSSYHDPFSVDKAFKFSLILGVAGLFWVHILWFIPLFWIGMYRFRSLSPRTFIASLLGFLSVCWFLLGWCVWKEDYSVWTVSFSSLITFGLTLPQPGGWPEWSLLLYTIFLTALASVNILTHEHEDNLRTRQFLSFLMLFALWALALFFVYASSAEEFIHIALVASVVLISHFFVTRRNRFTYWLFLFTILFYPFLLLVRLWSF